MDLKKNQNNFSKFLNTLEQKSGILDRKSEKSVISSRSDFSDITDFPPTLQNYTFLFFGSRPTFHVNIYFFFQLKQSHLFDAVFFQNSVGQRALMEASESHSVFIPKFSSPPAVKNSRPAARARRR